MFSVDLTPCPRLELAGWFSRATRGRAKLKADPPEIGLWRVARGTDEPNRVHVIGVIGDSKVNVVKEFLNSEHMQNVFAKVNEAATKPIEFNRFEDLTPG